MAEIGDRPRWLLRGLGDELLLVLPAHGPAPSGAQPVSARSIHHALGRWLAQDDGRAIVMQLYRAVMTPCADGSQHWTDGAIDARVKPVLRTAFERRQLVAYADWHADQEPGGGGSPPTKPPPTKPPPTKPPPTKPPPTKPPPHLIQTVKLVSLTITSDHQLLKDTDAHWKNSGDLLPEPEWADLSLPEENARSIVRLIDPERYGLNLREFILRD